MGKLLSNVFYSYFLDSIYGMWFRMNSFGHTLMVLFRTSYHKMLKKELVSECLISVE